MVCLACLTFACNGCLPSITSLPRVFHGNSLVPLFSILLLHFANTFAEVLVVIRWNGGKLVGVASVSVVTLCFPFAVLRRKVAFIGSTGEIACKSFSDTVTTCSCLPVAPSCFLFPRDFWQRDVRVDHGVSLTGGVRFSFKA